MTVDDPVPTSVVIEAVDRGTGAACRGCGTAVCGHEVVASYVLGFKASVRCLRCLARGLARAPDDLGAELRIRVAHRDCWHAGWHRADECERSAGAALSACPFASGPALGAAAVLPGAAPSAAGGRPVRVDARWDAGDLGCGDLVLELRQRLNALGSGQVLELVALDPGAPQDLPAWCGLTGHALVHADPPTFYLRRKE